MLSSPAEGSDPWPGLQTRREGLLSPLMEEEAEARAMLRHPDGDTGCLGRAGCLGSFQGRDLQGQQILGRDTAVHLLCLSKVPGACIG